MIDPVSWQARASIPKSFPDGTSNTLLFTEKYALCGNKGTLWGHNAEDQWQPAFAAWSKAPFQSQPEATTECDPVRASTPFPSLNVCLADGSVRGVAPSISQATWWAVCTPNGREVIGSDW